MDDNLEENIVINVEFMGGNVGTLTEVQVVPCNIAWEDFELMLKVYADQECITVKYLDEENDHVIISSQEELSEAFKVAKKDNNTLSLKVFCDQPVPRNESQASNNTTAQLDDGRKITAHTNVEDQTVSIQITVDNAKAQEKPVAMDTTEKTEEKCQEVTITKTFEGVPIKPKEPRRPRFFIRHKASGLVLDVNGQNPSPGTRVILWPQKPQGAFQRNQLWYEHKETNTLRSALNDLCITITAQSAMMQPYKADAVNQKWGLTNGKMQNVDIPEWVGVSPDTPCLQGASLILGNSQLNKDRAEWIKEPKEMQRKVTNSETGEKCPMPQGARPKKGKNHQDPYCRLAESIGNMERAKHQKSTQPPAAAGETPPAWFQFYMDKFKNEISEDIARMVARKTVSEVLKGLEGAVITSVRGSSGLGPLQEMFAAAAQTVVPDGATTKADGGEQPKHGSLYCHLGIICDQCERTIVGARYKCGNCEDYDLCEDCESTWAANHNPEHVFIKIRRPVSSAGRKKNGKMVPIIKRNLYTEAEHDASGDEEEGEEERQKKRLDKEKKRAYKLEEKVQQREAKIKRRQEKMAEKLKKHEEKLKRRLEENKEQPIKREKLDLPQFRNTERMDGEYVQDESIPDGTEVQPGTKLTKRWRLRNTGTHPWTSKTTLKMMWGNMTPVATDVSVPYLQPGDTGVVSVELWAPEEPGHYQSHWRLSHHGKRFGHRVWCSIVVVAKETLEVKGPSSVDLNVVEQTPAEEEKEETNAEAAAAQLQTPTQGGATRVIDADILTAQDLLSFEMLDIKERGVAKAKVSQTATPNNTPLAMSPPKSPVPEASPDTEEDHRPESPVDRHLSHSSSSSVEIVGDADDLMEDGEGPEEEEDIEWKTELVQERMANLGLRPDVDVESLSSDISDLESGGDSDSDFYIVPIPDCFNPTLPLSKSASTSVIVKKDVSGRSIDELLTASNSLESQPLLQPTQAAPQSPSLPVQVPVVTVEDTQDEVTEEPQVDKEEVQIVCVVPPQGDTPQEGATSAEVTQEEPQQQQLQAEAESDTEAQPEDQPDGEAQHEDQPDGEAQSEDQPDAEALPAEGAGAADTTEPKKPLSVPVSATSIVHAVSNIAHHAATQAYSTAKDVFHTLQARNQYVPPKSEWTPPQDNWTPPADNWTHPQEGWTPPQPQNDQPRNPTPMETLIEMGFANRELNTKLLEKYDNNLDPVIQELVHASELDWSNTRH